MGIRIGIGSLKIGQGSTGVDWSSYWATLISATVENAAPTNVVLTFPTAQTSLGATDFTITGFTVSSASWSDAVLTLILSTPVLVYHGNLTVTFTVTGGTTTVTNNVADDGNTVLWVDYTDAASITKDESNRVSQWNDKSGNSRHFTQATDDLKPILTSDGVLFDGSNDFMISPIFEYKEPKMMYLVFRQKTWTVNDRIIDGRTPSMAVYQRTSSPNIAIYSGSGLNNDDLGINEFGIVRALYYQANSKLQVNDNAAETASLIDTADSNGITLAAYVNGAGTQYGNVEFKECIFRKVKDSEAMEAAIYSYLLNKFFF
jgi:hypothetical protein